MSTLEKAKEIARKAHDGQTDKAGQPYIGHPCRVSQMGKTDAEKIVGMLHDVVEDSEWTLDMLREEGFSVEVIEALECLTKKSDDEPYDEFIERVSKNFLAVAVKLNDLKDNLDIHRLNEVTDKDARRLTKYLNAERKLKRVKRHTL
ncbi:MAG: hypothetical protein RSF94_06620 [Rikenellaceae bacterium]